MPSVCARISVRDPSPIQVFAINAFAVSPIAFPILDLMSVSSTRSQPETRFRAWLRLHDQDLADRAKEDIESTDELSSGVLAVSTSQFRALHNTAKMCATLTDLRRFIRKRGERRRASGQSSKADYWDTLLSKLSSVQDEFADPAVQACDVPAADSDSIRHKTFDERTAHLLAVRRYIEHFATHCQFVSQRDG